MKQLLIFGISLLFVNVLFAQHEHPQTDTTKSAAKPKSPRLSAMAMIGDNHVHIDYGSPSVRGRTIWNGLVAYNQVWATGAHKATWIEFSKDVMIQGKHVPKGRYGFFTIPNEKEWALILSKTWDMHLADDYKQEEDIIRLTVKPETNKEFVEALTYQVLSTKPTKGEIKMSWAHLSVSFGFENM